MLFFWLFSVSKFFLFCVKFVNFFNAKFKSYNEGDYVGVNNYLKIANSYYRVSSNKQYVIISFDIYTLRKPDRFTVENMALYIDKNKYLPDKTVCSKFSNLGSCYKKQYINNKEANYIVSYPIDNSNLSKAYIIYSDSYGKEYKIKLKIKES